MRALATKRQTRSGWQGLLTGPLRQQAKTAVREIADALAPLPTTVPADEAANLALFYGYLAAAWRTDAQAESYAERAFVYLNQAIDRAPHELRHPYLCGGYAGLGWVIANLAGKLFEQSEAENCAAIDEMINDFLRHPPASLEYELLYGLTGLGVYALERWPRPAAMECLQLVLTRLAETAERSAAGITWFTPPEQLSADQQALCPDGYYNLGLAHGVPGVLPLLARACALEPMRAQAQALLSGAGQWLQAQQKRDETGPYFTHWLAAGIEPRPGRVAWCYGGLGAATAWLDAAHRTGERAWERAALAILRRAAQTTIADSAIHDACLCHGAAGNAHIFNRLYQATGLELFRQAALQWYAHTLALRQPGRGLAGFRLWEPTASGAAGWAERPDFLDGVAGIGLALLAACTDYEPQWDRLLAVALF